MYINNKVYTNKRENKMSELENIELVLTNIAIQLERIADRLDSIEVNYIRKEEG